MLGTFQHARLSLLPRGKTVSVQLIDPLQARLNEWLLISLSVVLITFITFNPHAP